MTHYRMTDDQKRAAAAKALEFVHAGMSLGLGNGSTAEFFLLELGARVRQGLTIQATATSERTQVLAQELGIPILPLDVLGAPDITVDGADEVDQELRLIKGGGTALLREKMVATASKHMIVIADWKKHVETLGAFPLPVEISTLAPQTTIRLIAKAVTDAGCRGNQVELRGGEHPIVTDQGNFVVDVRCELIPNTQKLARSLSNITGVVAHGLFIGLCQTLILGHSHGLEIVMR